LSVEKRIKFGVVCILAILLANALLSYQATRTLINNDQWVRHTYQVINELEVILSTVKDAETGERGYIISGLDNFLEPYQAALAEIDNRIQALKALTADNPAHQARIPVLQRKINDRIESLKMGIALRRTGDAAGAYRLIASGIGKRQMDDLRQFISGMEADQNRLLIERTQESRRSQINAILTFVVASLVASIVLVATAVIITKGIVARKRAENDLRRERQLLQVTLSSIADAVIACDSQGSVTFLNPMAEDLTGWTQQEAEGQPLHNVFDLINEQTRQAVDNPALRAIREGTIVGLANHTVLRTKQGTEVPIDDSASPIKTADGRLLGAVLVFRNITERRRGEEALARSYEEQRRLLAEAESARERAETANRAKDEFLAILSHELRTPLTAVYGWVQLMQSRSVDDGTRAKAMEVIERNIRVQTELIDDLLSISRIVSGKLSIRREVTDPLKVVKSALETARPSADAKDIALILDSDEQVPAISADPARLQQIVWNLLSNAVKFTPKGGKVDIHVRTVRTDLQIVVKDSGEGISAEFLPRVFNRFTQADGSTTRSHGGLGLGLALVRQLVELHGGTVEAQSAGIGKGSTFTVRLPLQGDTVHSREEEQPTTREIGRRLNGVRVLVVEDDPDTREMIAHALHQSGANVIQAGTASEALRQFQQVRPHLLLTDIGMADMDGYQLLETIRAHALAPFIAVALTAYATPSDKERTLRSGFQAHVSKPVELPQLLSTVADLLDRHSWKS
jgi:PAS domain S-box-containing protein